VFRNSKRDDLVHEYGDMTYRLTNLAGVISYSNNIVSLPLRPVLKKYLLHMIFRCLVQRTIKTLI
jgi:hypothetical protein